MPALMWFRNDLRLHDNAALTWAAKRGPVVALLIDEPAPSPARPLGAAATWWREQSIRALAGAGIATPAQKRHPAAPQIGG